MGLLSEADQSEIKRIFEDLNRDVQIELFTQHESPLIIPGNDCPTCKDARQLLEEVVALSEKLHLNVHEVDRDEDLARSHNVHRIPALTMTAEGVNGKVRYFGLPSGYEFSVLLGSLIDVSNAQPDLSPETLELLSTLDKDVHIQVFVTPT